MDFDSLGEIIATRMLHILDEHGQKRPVSVFIGMPQPAKDSTGYACPFQVIGVGSQETCLARGHDSIQALQTAIGLIADDLNRLNDELGGRLFWNGGTKGGLGFLKQPEAAARF
jgi:Domain of unknown function (DUF6968)